MPKYGLQYSTDLGLIPISLLGDPEYPLIIDIGFGNGELLASMANENNQSNFIGIEVYDAGVGHCLNLIDERKIKNLKIINGDAVEVLRFGIVDASINEINLLFPDPWPKKRHHKRRIINDDFIQLISKKLMLNGLVNISTDWENYAEQIDGLFSKRQDFAKKPFSGRGISTKFEKRGVNLGHEIFDFCYELISQ
tara:strand:- start:512 stop:1096 length:585 start_codon:yes stop_codon:yes gene_type:complete